MTAEGKYNQAVWRVLQQIKEKYLATPEKPPPPPQDEYIIVTKPHGVEIWLHYGDEFNQQKNIIYKLQEQGAFKVLDETRGDFSYEGTRFILKILQPKFDEVYHKYEVGLKRDVVGEELTSPSPYKNTFDWKKLSPKNLEIAQKIVKITLDFLQLQGVNRLALRTRMPLQRFESERVYLDDISGVLNKIDGVEVINTRLHSQIKDHQRQKERFGHNFILDDLDIILDLPSEDELKNYVFLQISSLDELCRMRDIIGEEIQNHTPIKEQKKSLKSMHLVTKSLEPTTVIFLVLDERFEMPIRFTVKNNGGYPTYIKKLYDIAYLVNAPNKKVNYDKNTANGINNGLFRKSAVAKYMKTNILNKPTLVLKSENKTLVLKNEILVKTGLVQHDVPIQYQSIYIDKTR